MLHRCINMEEAINKLKYYFEILKRFGVGYIKKRIYLNVMCFLQYYYYHHLESYCAPINCMGGIKKVIDKDPYDPRQA